MKFIKNLIYFLVIALVIYCFIEYSGLFNQVDNPEGITNIVLDRDFICF